MANKNYLNQTAQTRISIPASNLALSAKLAEVKHPAVDPDNTDVPARKITRNKSGPTYLEVRFTYWQRLWICSTNLSLNRGGH